MDKSLITPSPSRILEASRAIRRHWSYAERQNRRLAADRRQIKLLRSLLPLGANSNARGERLPTARPMLCVVGG